MFTNGLASRLGVGNKDAQISSCIHTYSVVYSFFKIEENHLGPGTLSRLRRHFNPSDILQEPLSKVLPPKP